MMTDLVVMQNGEAVTSSLKVAEVFEKEHNHVLRDIKNLIEQDSRLKEYFIKGNYINSRNREYLCYSITKEGFLLLTSSYRGDEALEKKYQILKSSDMVPPTLPERKEKIFARKLHEFLESMNLELNEQYTISEYLVDFYIKEFSLVIEYDESYHETEKQQKLDREREEEILSHKNCNFLRLKSEDSDEYNLGIIALKLIELKAKK